mgnify:CR=1 FL=1
MHKKLWIDFFVFIKIVVVTKSRDSEILNCGVILDSFQEMKCEKFVGNHWIHLRRLDRIIILSFINYFIKEKFLCVKLQK